MGDHGKVYRTYNQEMFDKMGELVRHADIITPNFTEASILLNKKYTTDKLSINKLK